MTRKPYPNDPPRLSVASEDDEIKLPGTPKERRRWASRFFLWLSAMLSGKSSDK